LFQIAAVDEDEDAEVAGLALQALMGMGEDVRTEALALAQQPKQPLHRVGLAYLEALLGQPLVWVETGSFLMGSDKKKDAQAYDDELPQHEVDLPGYWIGRYPVTNKEYKRYRGDAGQAWDMPAGKADHPVVNVSWHDAQAYCRWLGEKTGLEVRLPSEAEWEKAASWEPASPQSFPLAGGMPAGQRGRKRIYPWGDEFDKEKCNTHESGIGTTTRVGTYSAAGGDSPYGCADMAGNVWEWTRSVYKEYPYDSGDGREDLEASGSRVLRGGSFYYDTRFTRCSYRGRHDAHDRYWDYGFRVVVSPISRSAL
jgi:formylglycine-generating enzyme required for sulfatase activity